jgi:archaeoflavoprotein AfpA
MVDHSLSSTIPLIGLAFYLPSQLSTSNQSVLLAKEITKINRYKENITIVSWSLMSLKFAWAITGAGDYMPESISIMKEIVTEHDVEVLVFLSKAGKQVIKWYKLMNELETISTQIRTEIDANTPFIAGTLQKKAHQFLVVMPASANTVAKIAYGIADTLVTNAIAQAMKTAVPIYIYPVDQKPGMVTTVLPSGAKLELITRDVDLENVKKLRAMKGMTVLGHPSEIKEHLKQYLK